MMGKDYCFSHFICFAEFSLHTLYGQLEECEENVTL